MFADALIPMAGGAFPLSDPFADQRPASVLINPSGALLQPDRWNTCVVTSASSVVLPPPAKGKVVKIHVSLNPYASTNLLTVNANGGENVGPGTATSRVMWAGESAVLVSFDGATWTKVAGLTIPMTCKIRASAAQTSGSTIPTAINAYFTVMLRTTVKDNTGLMASNDTITIKRAGDYGITCSGMISHSDSTGAGMLACIRYNGTDDSPRLTRYNFTPVAFIANFAGGVDMTGLANGDTLLFRLYDVATTGNASTEFTDNGNNEGYWCYLSATEKPSW